MTRYCKLSEFYALADEVIKVTQDSVINLEFFTGQLERANAEIALLKQQNSYMKSVSKLH